MINSKANRGTIGGLVVTTLARSRCLEPAKGPLFDFFPLILHFQSLMFKVSMFTLPFDSQAIKLTGLMEDINVYDIRQ